MKKLSRIVLPCVLFTTLLTSGCSNPEASKRKHFERAQTLAAQGKYPEAILEYRNALKADALYGEAHEKLAEAYFHVGNTQQGAKEIVRAADVLPQRADVQAKAATIMLASQDFESAKKFAQAALKADPKSVDAEIVLANALAGLRDVDGAVRELEESMQLAPGDSRPYTSLGAIKAVQGKQQEADAAYRKAIELAPKSVAPRLAFAYFLWSTKRLPQAETTLLDALRIDDKSELGNRMLAWLYLTQGRTSDAETPLLRLVNAKNVGATVTLADLYVRTGRAQQARPLYETLKTQKPTYALAVGRIASLDYAANKRDVATRAVDEALKREPNNTDLLTLKARWLVNENRLDEGLQVAQTAAAGAPKAAAPQFLLGAVHERRGERADAIKSYNDALRANPRFTPAAIALAGVMMRF
jgi:tetratricopeptide (TPR) repeat protein